MAATLSVRPLLSAAAEAPVATYLVSQRVPSIVVSTPTHSDLSRELTGGWIAAKPDEELLRSFALPDHDDSGWESVDVPGHWRNTPSFADSEELLYRHHFDSAAPGPGRRSWLAIDGLCYQGDIWLDGGYLGDTEGYFVPHLFEITEHLADRSEHVLAIEAACRKPSDLTAKRNITGVLQHWDNLDPDINPGGLWRRVRLEETGPVRIDTLRVVVAEADTERAILQFHAVLDSVAAHTATVETLIDHARPVDGTGDVATQSEEHLLSAGTNVLEWRMAVERPSLWWPHSMGDQPMYDIRVAVDVAGLTSHVRKRRTGLRRFELNNWIASVNGERLFLKGTNFAPASADLASVTRDDLAHDLDLVTEAGLDLVRLHGHISHPEFYREADVRGVLIWQDFPLQWGYAKGVKPQATRQAEAMVDMLAHHPSVAIWCGHNEPIPLDARPGKRPDAEPTNRFFRRGSMQHELPSWNRTVLDRAVKRTIARADPSRPVIAHSGVLPHPPQLDGTDSHLYFGWYQGDIDGLKTLAKRLPRMVRFVSEFGAQSVPHRTKPADAANWPDLDWRELSDRYGLQHDVMQQRVPTDDHQSFESWSAATRTYQGQVIRAQIETLRKLKYRPTGGFCQFFFADAADMISCSVLDQERRPKEPAFSALSAACQQVIVTADPLPKAIAVDTVVRQAIHVVSDLRKPIAEAEVEVELRWPSGVRSWQFGGALEADSVAKVGDIEWTIPDRRGPVTLELTLRFDETVLKNRYESVALD